MESSSIDLEPDVSPLYPTPTGVAPLLSPNFGLSPAQKSQLVSHCLTRACVFGELTLLSYLLQDPQAQPYIDLGIQDEEGLGLVSTTILGFGSDSDRDIEREECIRMLLSEGAELEIPDKAGWTPLHYAALLSPPTLVSYFLKSGCSPFSLTLRKLTALDIVTAHTILPGRETVALLLEEAMRGEGWTGGRMEEQRRTLELRIRRRGKRKEVRDDVGRVLEVNPKWWGDEDEEYASSDSSDDGDEFDDDIYTPPNDFGSMLAFSPPWLPEIFQSLVINFPTTRRNAEPANALYMLARFACLTCDQTWLEDLIIGATDAIEDTFFSRPDDLTCLVFWLYNTTVWLHLMKCDNSINLVCENLGSFVLIEEVINSVFVFIIRFAERRVDELLDPALLDHAPLSSEFDSIQFESEWSLFRSFGNKKKPIPAPIPTLRQLPPSPSPSSRPSSPPPIPPTPHSSKGFASLRETFSRARGSSGAIPLQALFSEHSEKHTGPSPADITSFLTALHTLLTLSGVNPALTTQFWSQVMYWTACETFNRISTRKKYLCRYEINWLPQSRAVQISVNLGILEEWVGKMGLPRGVQSHFAPVRDLLNWLQCLSSISEFPNLIATIQTMKHLNPLQMRRAVRDYKYEVNESRMTEECSQYLAQLQKDWERHRVKLGVDAMRKEIDERDRDADSMFSTDDGPPSTLLTPSILSTTSSETSAAQRGIDMLFDRTQAKSVWEPARPPEALGELLDSRYMLPLLFPTDPRMLAASPGDIPSTPSERKQNAMSLSVAPNNRERSVTPASAGSRGALEWRLRGRRVRDVGVETLRWVDGIGYASRWGRAMETEYEGDAEGGAASDGSDGSLVYREGPAALQHATPLTRKPSSRIRTGRTSLGTGDNESVI